MPAPGQTRSDCYFIEAETAGEIQRLIVQAATKSLPARCGADPFRDIQILTPKLKGLLGTISLNEQVQTALQISDKEADSSIHSFLPGDRVLHTKNDYRLNVFNGQCGAVKQASESKVTVSYGEKLVDYSRSAMSELIHGFAISIHRSQGSEYPFVIIPIHQSQQPMLSRELLYTAITRGQKMVVVIGSRRAFEMAIENSTIGKRYTGLKDAILRTMQPRAFSHAA